ncbi:hypothetical protein Tco_0292104 [Tanacetum coccineum]
MVLSSNYSMPPKQYPPSILESLAAIAENLSKLVDTMTINNEKLTESQSKLNVAIKNLIATQNTHPPVIITNTAKPENTMAKYFPNSTSYAMPLTYKPPPLEDASTNLADTRTKCFSEPTSYTIKPKIISKDVVTQNNSPIINVTTTITMTPTSIQPIITPPPKNHGLKINHRKPVAKSLNATAIFITKIQLDVTTQTRVPLHPVIMDMLPIFHCVKTFFVGHQGHPPKLVFLQSEPKTPWKSLDLRYTTMSLEDKARFEA